MNRIDDRGDAEAARMTAQPTYAELLSCVRLAADTGYDGRPCSHDEGCHDHEECQEPGCSQTVLGANCECPRGDCCSPWDMGTDEEHDNLATLVEEARSIIARFLVQA